MMKTKAPKNLWDHCLELEALIRSNTAQSSYELDSQVPETVVSGQTSDISTVAEFAWYDWIYWWDTVSGFPEPREQLGRWLGPALDIGPAMTAKVLKENGQYVYTSSYRALHEDELTDPTKIKEREEFDRAIRTKLGAPVSSEDELNSIDPEAVTPQFSLYEDDIQKPENVPDIDNVTPEDFDNYVGAEVNLPIGGTLRQGKVKRRARGVDGELHGTQNDNPILDTRTYEVEFPDGEFAEYSANVIAEHLLSQCDPNGNQYQLMDDIVDHRSDQTAVTDKDRFVTVNGRKHPRKTTTGWFLCVQWKDGSTSWERLADLKESYPVELAEYAVAHDIVHEPAFDWWVPVILRRRDRIIKAVSKRYHKRTHKFGIEIPKSVKRALEIDKENGNNCWRDAIAKEMEDVRIAFKILGDDVDPPQNYQFMECHMIFDVKLDGLKRKARLVAGGHMTDAPAVLTYASVVSRETVRIALTLAALNDLEVKASDIQNAYLTAPCEELIWTVLGPEFGADEGKRALIVRALYGLKSAGASFSRHLADCMRHLGYKPCKADPDLWMKAETRPEDGFLYYAYILLYVDDCLCIHHNATEALEKLDTFFMMKPGSIGDPDIYLGSKLRKVQLDNGVWAWGQSPSKYIQDACRNAEEYLSKRFNGRKFQKRVSGPWPANYMAEVDVSPELGSEQAAYYQSQCGVLHWIVELGRVDIVTEVSCLASHMALPREGHLDAVFHVFGYLAAKHNSRLVFDPTYPEIDESRFQVHDWGSFYGDVKEAIPSDCPTPRGKEVVLRAYVDADHAADRKTRRSRTGFFVFVNSALVSWLSRKQPTVETSVFGSEFVAMKTVTDYLRGLRYKLRMMGVPLETPTYIFGDNMSVIHNSQRPESTLRKKSNEICYHAVRESVAMGESLVGHVPSESNPADLATKIIPGGQKRSGLVGMLLHDICDH